MSRVVKILAVVAAFGLGLIAAMFLAMAIRSEDEKPGDEEGVPVEGGEESLFETPAGAAEIEIPADAPDAATAPAAAAFWPAFHGPRRDNQSPDTGLRKRWPEDGPPLVWEYDRCGVGYSGVSIAEGMVFTAGDFDDEELVVALGMDGKLLWTSANGGAWRGPTPGSRGTPTYEDGILYHMNPTGRVASYRAKTGEPIWAVDLGKQFDARWGTWALAENLILDGDRLLCLPGGTKAAAVALDKRTGRTLWTAAEPDERAGYCSPIVAEHRGVRQFITMTSRAAVGYDVETGELLWSHPHGRFGQNSTPPVFHDGHVFIACGHSAGGRMLKLADDSRGVAEAWYRVEFDNCHGGVLLLDGRLYGSACRLGGKGYYCVDFRTGETIQVDRELGKVSVTYADGMIYAVNDRGLMSLVEVKPDGFEVVSRFQLPGKGEDQLLAHPVVCGGRLYVRHDQFLYVYDVRAKP